jgi:hypothetical protein
VKDIFNDALEVEPPSRDGFIRERCGGDAGLFAEVKSLLRQWELPTSPALKKPPVTALGLPERDLTGRQLGNYKVIARVGSGGMGVVYRAEHAQLLREVAIKVMSADVAATGGEKRFDREAQILARLRHPGIVFAYDAGLERDEHGAFRYFVMEFVPDATPITTYAAREGLTDRAKLELFLRVCEAVEQAHAKRIVHRDLKPGNILVDRDGQVRVIDFGLANVAAEMASEKREVVGTPAYMSPEQCVGDPAAIDERSDVYSLGVVLYELISGWFPYDLENRSVGQQIDIIRRVEAADLAHARPDLRGDLADVVRRALAKQAEHRHQSVREFADEIRRFLAGRPVRSSERDGLGAVLASLRAFARRQRFVAAACVCLIAAMLAQTYGPPLVYNMTRLDLGFQWLVATRLVPARAPASFDRVRIVEMPSNKRLAELAAQYGVTGVDEEDPTSVRRLHALFMKKLVDADAKVLTWLVHFGSERNADEFLEGVAALQGKPNPTNVQVACKTWRTSDGDKPAVSEKISRAVAVGTVSISRGAGTPPMVDIAYFGNSKKADQLKAPLPSAVLGTIIAMKQGDTAYQLEPEPVRGGMRVFYKKSLPGRDNWERTGEEPDQLYSGLQQVEQADSAVGINAGDLLAIYLLPVPNMDALRAATVSYEQVLAADPDQLKGWFKDRAILVGSVDDPSSLIVTGYGEYRAPHLHATAVEAILKKLVPHPPTLMQSWIFTVAGGLAGVLAIGLAASGVRRAVTFAALTIGAVVGSVVLYAATLLLCNPAVPLLAMLTAALLAAGLGLRLPFALGREARA